MVLQLASRFRLSSYIGIFRPAIVRSPPPLLLVRFLSFSLFSLLNFFYLIPLLFPHNLSSLPSSLNFYLVTFILSLLFSIFHSKHFLTHLIPSLLPSPPHSVLRSLLCLTFPPLTSFTYSLSSLLHASSPLPPPYLTYLSDSYTVFHLPHPLYFLFSSILYYSVDFSHKRFLNLSLFFLLRFPI